MVESRKAAVTQKKAKSLVLSCVCIFFGEHVVPVCSASMSAETRHPSKLLHHNACARVCAFLYTYKFLSAFYHKFAYDRTKTKAEKTCRRKQHWL